MLATGRCGGSDRRRPRRAGRIVLGAVLLAAALLTAGRDLAAQPPTGSHLSEDDNNCAKCHGDEDLWEGDTLRLFVSPEKMAKDVHFLKGVNCSDCHGGDPSSFDVPVAHATEVEAGSKVVPFRAPLAEVKKACAKCHENQSKGMLEGIHGKLAKPAEEGAIKPPSTCFKCHGDNPHLILPAADSQSPVFSANQLQLCGKCHQDAQESYLRSVHGIGLEKAGLLVSAVCADCHGAHAIYPKSNPRSTLFETNVAGTCGKCHRFIEQRLAKSVHGREAGPGGQTKEPAPGGDVTHTPSCTDCHQGHDLPDPSSIRFRSKLPDRCGSCHGELSRQYALSMHGELTELGYGPAANCSDCHGSHEIQPISSLASMVSPENREATCRKCHPYASGNFLNFDPHADHRDMHRNPTLFWVYVVLMTFLISTMGIFGLHSLLWFVRGLFDVRKHGRAKSLVPGATAYVRFGPFHRAAHAVMVVSFLGLALTGLPLKYSHLEWAQVLARSMGGFESTGLWHRIFGVVNISCLVIYLVRMMGRLWGGYRNGSPLIHTVFGPDSPVPNFRDAKDFLRMARWFGGLGPKPKFERWAYWEKVDFWGAAADIVIIGTTGLVLWFPGLFTSFLPGETLNVAKVIHSTQALLATAFVFAIHFFATHVRPDKFPMDMSVLTGLVSAEEFEEERPEYFERLREQGALEAKQVKAPPRRVLRATFGVGLVALGVGLALLVGIVVAIVSG